MHSFLRRMPILLVGLVWAGLILYGGRTLLNYEGTAGTPGNPPSRWPSSSRITRPNGKFVLVMFAHPNCPCTRAGMTEIEILMAQLQGKLAAFLVFSKPASDEEEAEAASLWRRAARIPGVSVSYDDRGTETDRFGAQVSGQSMLYDLDGKLVFSGGITAARGHEGDNDGVDGIISLVTESEVGTPIHTPVFGCALHDPSAKTLTEDSSWKKR